MTTESDRSFGNAMFLGWKMLCPNCGKSKLMKSYLKVSINCNSCLRKYHYQRADDGPAYITILVLGHLLVPLILVCYETLRPEPSTMAVGFSLLAIVLALYLLPRIKGALIWLQWAKSMHGF